MDNITVDVGATGLGAELGDDVLLVGEGADHRRGGRPR